MCLAVANWCCCIILCVLLLRCVVSPESNIFPTYRSVQLSYSYDFIRKVCNELTSLFSTLMEVYYVSQHYYLHNYYYCF
jgi:hypothetical protein